MPLSLRHGGAGLIAPVLSAVLTVSASMGVLCSDGESELFDPVIKSCASEYGLDPLLVKAVIWQESKFKPRSSGKSGEIGLMQLKMSVVSDWAAAMGRKTPGREEVFDPYLNIEIGVWLLARASGAWKAKPSSVLLALTEYNIGRTALLRKIKYHGSIARFIKITDATPDAYANLVYSKYISYSVLAEQRLLARLALIPQMPTLPGEM